MSRRFVLAVVVLVMAALGGAWLFMSRNEDVARGTASLEKTWQARSAKPPRPRTEAAAEFPPSSIPPANVPVADGYEQLLRASSQGNFRAQCRLAAEISRCRALPDQRSALERYFGTRPPREKAEPLRQEFNRDVEECARLPYDGRVPAWYYLFSAAVNGHVPSMARFAIAPPLNLTDAAADPEGWRVYRSHAAALLRHAADAGDRGAVSYLAMTYSGDRMMPRLDLGGVPLAPADDFLAAKNAHVLAAIDPRSTLARALIAIGRDALPPDRFDAARAEAGLLVATFKSEAFVRQPSYVRGQVLGKAGIDCYE